MNKVKNKVMNKVINKRTKEVYNKAINGVMYNDKIMEIFQLKERVQELERVVEELKNNRPNESRVLEAGVEYISIIEEGSSRVDKFEWEDKLWWKYLIKLNGTTELYELIIPTHKRQPVIGDSIRHYVIGKTIKTWRYVKTNENE
jgi:hypothetical protein